MGESFETIPIAFRRILETPRRYHIVTSTSDSGFESPSLPVKLFAVRHRFLLENLRAFAAEMDNVRNRNAKQNKPD